MDMLILDFTKAFDTVQHKTGVLWNKVGYTQMVRELVNISSTTASS